MSDVFVFGVGRSGTTMTYCLLQSMFSRHYAEHCHFTYEPYIWDPEQFTRPYANMADLFGKTSSLSVSGIYSHLNTPLFITGAWQPGILDAVFYHRFRPRADNQPHLVKFVRGSGRMRLFRALNPQARFVLLIRNPLDVVNSVKNKFSFFGDDFYPSDFPRFCDELRREYGATFESEAPSWAERQGEYCYQMNRASLEFSRSDSRTLVVDFDRLTEERDAFVARLCEFLDLPFSEEWVAALRTPTGPTTKGISLSESELAALERYAVLHENLCRTQGLGATLPAEEIIVHYRGRCSGADYNQAYDGLATNPLRRTIRVRDRRIRELERALETASSAR